MAGVAVALGMLWRYGEPRGGDQWTTVGTFVYDYLTLGLLIAAIYGGVKLTQQLDVERDANRDQRESAGRQLQLLEDQAAHARRATLEQLVLMRGVQDASEAQVAVLGLQEQTMNLAAVAQLNEMRQATAAQLQEMKDSRAALIRPVVFPAGARLWDSGAGRHPLIVRLKNVGHGPALRAETKCWLFPDSDSESTWLDQASGLADQIVAMQTRPPDATGLTVDPLGAGEEREIMLLSGDGKEPVRFTGNHYWVMVTLTYRDTFGNEYPFPEQPHEWVTPHGLSARVKGGEPV